MNQIRDAAVRLVALLEENNYVIGRDCDDGYMSGYMVTPDPPDLDELTAILGFALIQAGIDFPVLLAIAEAARALAAGPDAAGWNALYAALDALNRDSAP